MGVYINPGSSGFEEINHSEYIDKTMLIDLVNQTLGTTNKLTCISRPRRFGKSYAAKMLTAYYDCSCDSHQLFDDKNISGTKDYEKHLNQYNVICLDITSFISDARIKNQSLRGVPDMIQNALQKDMIDSGFEYVEGDSLTEYLIRNAQKPDGKKFIFIIDEWDAMIREAKNDEIAQQAYLNLLRSWFKNNTFTPKVVAAAYMTGILPIKKDRSQSAISDFREYSMINPRKYGEFVGFTQEEVKGLCEKKGIDFHTMKRWYDGYSIKDAGSIYNPNSVMHAVENDDFDSYWTQTSAAEGLLDYISKDYNGLTLMIHLGYLSYDSVKKTVRIPNEEIKQEFQRSIHEVRHEATLKRLEESEQLFADTIQKNGEAVAAQIEKIHFEETTALHYNREDSLRSVIKPAYYTYRDHYLQFVELPAGEGIADIVYLPRPDSHWPALVVELKWNQSAHGAIGQIMKKKYPSALKHLDCPILLVGINYDKDAKAGEKRHTCVIVEYKK